jgi:hypothetical protein
LLLLLLLLLLLHASINDSVPLVARRYASLPQDAAIHTYGIPGAQHHRAAIQHQVAIILHDQHALAAAAP